MGEKRENSCKQGDQHERGRRGWGENERMNGSFGERTRNQQSRESEKGGLHRKERKGAIDE